MTSFGDGTYLVGRDIALGIYTAGGSGIAGETCDWRMIAPSSILDLGPVRVARSLNDTPGGYVGFTAANDGYGFYSKNCGTWTRDPRSK